MTIRAVTREDVEHVVEIYNHYIQTTAITFETEAVSLGEMTNRVEEIAAHYPWLVLEDNNTLVGYAYGSWYHKRPAYRFTVQTTIYLKPGMARRGYGTQLYTELLLRLRAQEYRTALGIIALPNPASVRLHEKLGFQKVAHLTEVGWKFGRWIDTGYWQLPLERFATSA